MTHGEDDEGNLCTENRKIYGYNINKKKERKKSKMANLSDVLHGETDKKVQKDSLQTQLTSGCPNSIPEASIDTDENLFVRLNRRQEGLETQIKEINVTLNNFINVISQQMQMMNHLISTITAARPAPVTQSYTHQQHF